MGVKVHKDFDTIVVFLFTLAGQTTEKIEKKNAALPLSSFLQCKNSHSKQNPA